MVKALETVTEFVLGRFSFKFYYIFNDASVLRENERPYRVHITLFSCENFGHLRDREDVLGLLFFLGDTIMSFIHFLHSIYYPGS